MRRSPPSCAIVPGSRFAIALLHCVLLEPCDALAGMGGLRITKYVDNLALAKEGMARDVAEVLFDSAAWLIDWLQRELQLETSTDKSEMLASTPWLARALHRRGRTLGIRLTAAARLLGCSRRGQ